MQTAIKERPILFSGEMVRAILAGRKTETRRIIKPQPERRPVPCGYVASGWALEGLPNDFGVKGCSCNEVACPFPDDVERLWVRESFRFYGCGTDDAQIIYADGRTTELGPNSGDVPDESLATYFRMVDKSRKAKRSISVPSIHMPRWASRINLEITKVRAERLQDIDALDALAEGVEGTHVITGTLRESGGRERTGEFIEGCPRDGYAQLWDQINGPGAWDLNPWVWVVEFKRIAL